jgi:hypothetical protein
MTSKYGMTIILKKERMKEEKKSILFYISKEGQ